MQLCTQDGAEVTFDSYKERQMHYAGMKRPISMLYTVMLCFLFPPHDHFTATDLGQATPKP